MLSLTIYNELKTHYRNVGSWIFYNTESMKQANIGYANVEETAVLFKMCCSILFMHGKYNSFLLVPLNIFKIKWIWRGFVFYSLWLY